MNKQKWTEKPVTWGGYLKLSGIVTVIGRDFSARCISLPCLSRPGGSGFGRRLERRSTIGPGKGIVSKGRSRCNRRLLFFFFPPRLFLRKRGCALRIAVERRQTPMNEQEFHPGSVPVAVVARVYGKDASWVRAGNYLRLAAHRQGDPERQSGGQH